MKILTLILCVSLAACSSNDTKPKVLKVTTLIENIDRSGTLHHLGGMLINDHQLIHVTHWPVKIGQPVRLPGKNGINTFRNVLSKEVLVLDLCILTLDEPVDLNNHTIIPVAEPIIGQPTTILRFEARPRRGTSIVGYGYAGRLKLALTSANYLESGDSGKAWIQVQQGKHVVVGLSSTTKGYGPPVYKLLTEWLANDKEL
tara:strand:- start:51 stop:653 length:603 start_codon:yes stop_codon:yes gene_type:complete